MRKGLVLFFIAGALQGAVWIRTYDVDSTETLISASTTSDGGFILLGSKGDSVLLIKLDSLGNLVWGKAYGHTFPLHPASVIQTTDGGYVILGKKGSITPSIFVIKTNSAGDISWARGIVFSDTIASLTLDLASIIQTLDGNYTLVGSLFANLLLTSITSAIMVKLNTYGGIIWSQFLNGAFYHEFPTGLLQIPGGNYVVAGYLDTTGGNPRPFLLKTDTGGNRIWWKIYTSGPNRKIFSLDTFSNGFVMAGVSDSSGLIMRVDNNGNPRWAKTYSSSDSVRFNSIRRTSGGFVLTGRTGNNVLLVKTDTSGNVIWAKRFSGFSTSAEGISLRVLGDGIFIGGNSDTNLLTIKTNNSGMVPSCESFVTDVSLNTTNLSLSAGSVTPASVPLTLLITPLSPSVSTPSITTSTVCLDATRPYVVSTYPANGDTGVARDTSIRVVFSERIDTSTVDTLSIRIVVRSVTYTFTKSCTDDTVCVLTPTSPFNYRDTVWVYFDTLITDLAGNPLIPHSIYFVIRDTTIDATRPRIVLTHPDSGSIYVSLSANIGVWFSKPIIDTTINASSVSITGWDGSSFRTYSFNRICPMLNFCVLDPILNFRPSEEITVRFDSTIRDNSGNPLIPKVIVFRTQGVDTLNPVVVFTTPDSGAVNVPSNTKISVQFSRDMDTTTIDSTNVIISGSSTGPHTFNKVCRTLSYCEINPLSSFDNSGETVTVEFRSGIMALNGRNLVPRIITFTTGLPDNTPPNITIISDSDDTVRLYDRSIPIKASVSDNYGIQKVEWVINSQTYISPTNCDGNIYRNPDTSCFYIPDIPAGTYRIIAYAYDYSGNVGRDSAYLKYRDTIKPYVVFTDPINNSYGISPTPLITVVFSEGMDTTSGSLDIRVGSSTYPYTKSWEDLRTLKIRNTTPLPYDSTVKVVLRNYRDLSGNTMVGDSFSFRFTIISNAEVFIRILNVNPNTVYKGSPDSTYILAEVSSRYNIRGAKTVINGSVEVSMFAKDGSFDEPVETVYVRYRFGELEVGEYSVSIKAWNDYVERSSDPFIIMVKSIGFLDKENVVIYPNPTKGQAKLRVMFGANTNAVIEVFDLKVKRVYYREGSFDGFKTYEFEIPKLPTGLYLVRIRAGDKKVEKWFSVIK